MNYLFSIGLVSIALFCGCEVLYFAGPKPNIIFIHSDDLAQGDVGQLLDLLRELEIDDQTPSCSRVTTDLRLLQIPK